MGVWVANNLGRSGEGEEGVVLCSSQVFPLTAVCGAAPRQGRGGVPVVHMAASCDSGRD